LLHHPTTEHLRELGLVGMARALEEMRRRPDSVALDFEDRLALMVDRKRLERDTKLLHTRLRFAVHGRYDTIDLPVDCACRRRRKMSIIAPLGASIVRCSRS
jgi:hypothetical protein